MIKIKAAKPTFNVSLSVNFKAYRAVWGCLSCICNSIYYNDLYVKIQYDPLLFTHNVDKLSFSVNMRPLLDEEVIRLWVIGIAHALGFARNKARLAVKMPGHPDNSAAHNAPYSRSKIRRNCNYSLLPSSNIDHITAVSDRSVNATL